MSKRDVRITLRQIAEYARHAQAICEDKSPHEIAADWREAFAFERVTATTRWIIKCFGMRYETICRCC